jgi:signal transduction histidine kinase
MELFIDCRRSADRPVEPAELEQSERLLGCYQTFLGHELPNQLVALQAFARLLLPSEGANVEGGALDPETRTLLERVADLTAGVDGLVRRMAELVRLCREPPLGPPCSLVEVVQEAAAEVHCTGDPFLCLPAPDLPVLALSRRLLHEVFVQLFRNAAQARSGPDPVRVEVEGECDPPTYPGWSVALSVRDNGRGVSEARATQLFQPFVPSIGRPGTRDKPTLGLFLVRQILTRWSGAIRVRSTVAAPDGSSEPASLGTTFTLLLPSKG